MLPNTTHIDLYNTGDGTRTRKRTWIALFSTKIRGPGRTLNLGVVAGSRAVVVCEHTCQTATCSLAWETLPTPPHPSSQRSRVNVLLFNARGGLNVRARRSSRAACYRVLPRATAYYRVLPRTTACCRVLPRTTRTTCHVLPPFSHCTTTLVRILKEIFISVRDAGR